MSPLPPGPPRSPRCPPHDRSRIFFRGRPAATVDSLSRAEIFVRGDDDAVWHTWDTSAGWHAWEALGGQIHDPPVVVRYPWGERVFVRNANGNVRELRACVSIVHEQGEYEPPSGFAEPTSGAARPAAVPASPGAASPGGSGSPPLVTAPAPGAELARAVLEGTLSLAELRHRYILQMFALAGSYVEAGRRLQIDWRTVRAAVELEAAARLAVDRAAVDRAAADLAAGTAEAMGEAMAQATAMAMATAEAMVEAMAEAMATATAIDPAFC